MVFIVILFQPESCTKISDHPEMVGSGSSTYLGRRPGSSPAPPSRSRSISSEMEVLRQLPGTSPHGSTDHLDTGSPTYQQRYDMIMYIDF